MHQLDMTELTHCLKYLRKLNDKSGIAEAMLRKLPQFIAEMDSTLNDAHQQITYLTNVVAKIRKVSPHRLETSMVTKRQITNLRKRLYVPSQVSESTGISRVSAL